jgi:hypothetical protein
MELVEAIATSEVEAQEYLRAKGFAVDEKSTDGDTMDRRLTIVETEMGTWFDMYKRELIDLKRQVEWMREVSPDPQMKKIVWNEEIFPGVGCADIPAGETITGVHARRQIYAYFDTCDSREIIRSEQLGLNCDGEVLIAGGQCMMTAEEEDKYYPNLDLLMKLCFKSNSGLDDEGSEFGKREMWNYSAHLYKNADMKTFKRPTLQEIKVIVNDFNIKLLGNHIFIDVDTGEEGEYIGYGWKETRKLPNGWQKKLNVEKNKFFYWNENTYGLDGKKVSTWEHPLNKDNKISPSPNFSDAQYNSILNRKKRSVGM